MPPKITELRAQLLNRQNQGGKTLAAPVDPSAPSASTTILERIKTNQANRGEDEVCVFQNLVLDRTVVTQLQEMKAFREMMPSEFATMGQPPAHGSGGAQSPHAQGPSSFSGSVAKAKVHRQQRLRGTTDGPSILIPVTNERVRISDMKDALRDEYAARYCEHIGVAPSQQNMSLVLKLMPFERCRVTQSTQQNGIGRTERRNNVVIEPCFHAPPTTGPGVDDVPFELLTLEAMSQKNTAGTAAHNPRAPGVGDGDGGSPDAPGEDGFSATTMANRRVVFEQYKGTFVYPFNLEERFKALDATPQPKKSPMDRAHNASPSSAPKHLPRPPAGTGSSSIAQGAPPQDGATTGPNALLRLAVQDALLTKLRSEAMQNGDPHHGGGLSEEELRTIAARMRREEASCPPAEAEAHNGDNGWCVHDNSAAVVPPPIDGVAPLADMTVTAVEAPQSSNRRMRLDAALQKELSTPWVDPESTEVRQLQVQFVKDFPFYRFDGRLSEAELLDVKGVLIADDVSDVVLHTLHFLYTAYVSPIAEKDPGTLNTAAKDAQFLVVCRTMIRFMNHHQRSPLAMEVIPLCILLIRVVVDALVASRFPLFHRHRDGQEVVRRMDKLVRALLDPFGLQSRIVVLESTPQAQRVLRTKRLPQRMSPMATTPLVQFIVGDGAKSTEAKRMTRSAHGEASAGLAELRAHLTPTVRAELLRIVTDERIQQKR